jgi:hypothetical protein
LALSFLLVWFFYAAGLFIYTFFSPKALKLRKSGHKKNELNLKELLVSPTSHHSKVTLQGNDYRVKYAIKRQGHF